MDSTETGLIDKWEKTGLSEGYKMFANNDFVFNSEKTIHCMDLDQLKIVLGPYSVGILMAIFAFIFENYKTFLKKAP